MGGRDDVAHFVHLGDEVSIRRSLGQFGPIGQVDGALPGQSAPHLLGQERQERGGGLGDGDQRRVEGVEGGGVLVPEAVARGAHVPVGQHVEVDAQRLGGLGDLVGVELGAQCVDQALRVGQKVAVLDVQGGDGVRVVDVDGRGQIAGPLLRGVRVEGEEVVGVPQGQEDVAHGVADAVLGDDEVAAADDRRAHEEPPHGVRAVLVEHLGDVRVVAQRLAHLAPVVPQDDPV